MKEKTIDEVKENLKRAFLQRNALYRNSDDYTIDDFKFLLKTYNKIIRKSEKYLLKHTQGAKILDEFYNENKKDLKNG